MVALLEKVRKKVKFGSPYKVDSKNGWFYLGFGQDLRTKELGRIYWEKLQNQGIVFGASGSGKSELVARKTYEDIMTGYQSFNIDPKGSKSWLGAFLKACYRQGILYDRERGPIILALPYPNVSFRFNPLQGLTPHQIAFVVASGIPESKEPFWWQISYEITLVVALGLKARGIEQITFSDIYNYISVENIEQLQNKVISDTKIDSEYREEALRTLSKLTTYDPQFFPRVNSSLRTYLTRLITGEAGKILNVRLKKNLLEERLDRGELRFFAFLNAEAMKQTAYDVARLLLAWMLTYVGKKSGELKTIEPQLRVNVDEVTEVAFHEINKAVRLVRERNVSMFMLTQSPSGLAGAFPKDGKQVVEDIMNSCDLRVFFRMNSKEDSKYVSSLSPEVEKPRAIIHKNSISITYQRSRLIEEFDTQELKEGYGYAFLDGTVYYFYTPMHKDSLKVEVVWTDEPEKVEGDLVVNMKKLASNYLPFDERDVLVVLMQELKENWKVGRHYVFENHDVQGFYELTHKFMQVFKEDYFKVLDFIQGFKDFASAVKGGGFAKKISLLDHSLRVASNAYENVKDREDMTQEEKEIVILSALVHDLGKAVATKKNYTKKDHVLLTRDILVKLGLDKRIIKAACDHHEQETDKLSREVKKADQQAREEERKITGQSTGKEINVQSIINRIKSNVNKSGDVIYVGHGNTYAIYVRKEYLMESFSSSGIHGISDEEIEKVLEGKFVEARLRVGREVKGHGIWFRIDIEDRDEAYRLSAEKMKPGCPYRNYFVEETG